MSVNAPTVMSGVTVMARTCRAVELADGDVILDAAATPPRLVRLYRRELVFTKPGESGYRRGEACAVRFRDKDNTPIQLDADQNVLVADL